MTEEVGINNGESVIHIVTCMMIIRRISDFCRIFTLSSKFLLIFKWPKSEETWFLVILNFEQLYLSDYRIDRLQVKLDLHLNANANDAC